MRTFPGIPWEMHDSNGIVTKLCYKRHSQPNLPHHVENGVGRMNPVGLEERLLEGFPKVLQFLCHDSPYKHTVLSIVNQLAALHRGTGVGCVYTTPRKPSNKEAQHWRRDSLTAAYYQGNTQSCSNSP